MTQSRLFFYSRKTQPIHDAILKHIAVSPYTKIVHLKRADFDLLRGTAIYPYMRNKEILDYIDGYKVRADS
jgi:hypothetical protein